MQPEELTFSFKGSRDYVHGTDMFNALVGVHRASSLHGVHFTIHGFVRTPRCLVHRAASAEALRDLADIKVRAAFSRSGVREWAVLTESTGSGAPRHSEYREDRVTSLCEIHGCGIELKGESPFTFIETVVPMNKHLHQQLFPAASGKWVFTGIDLDKGCDARRDISLSIGREVNYRLTRAEILHAGRTVGNLFFSLAKP